MKRLLILSVSLLGAISNLAFAQKHAVSIQLQNLSTAKGQLLISIFNKANGFPEEVSAAYSNVVFKEPLRKNLVLFLPKGTYALAIVHDKNKNNKMDKNLFGAPTEPYGVSLNKTHLLKAPLFEENKFVMQSDTSLTIYLK